VVRRTAYAKLARDAGMNHPVQYMEPAARTRAERSWLVREWNRLPRTLAFCLLAFQVVIPWTATHFVTQDGPSHLYQAVVAQDVLLHPHSQYASIYRLQKKVVPNWTCTILLNMTAWPAGRDHAEQLLASLCILAGFFSFAYCCRSLNPSFSPWSPVANLLLHTWFFWIGFYNFFLGMVLLPFVLGYYIQHGRTLTLRRAAVVAGMLLGLFFTHLIPAALAMMGLCVLAAWFYLLDPMMASPRVARFSDITRKALYPSALLAGALMPCIVLLGAFVLAGSEQPLTFKPDVELAWTRFPFHVFAATAGRSGHQDLLWPALLFYIAIAPLAMRRREWRTPRVPVLVTAILILVLYFVTPNRGFGGDEAKIRLAWGVFLLGSLVAMSIARLRPIRTAVSVYVACFLTGSLISAMLMNRAMSRAVDAYVGAAAAIPKGATFVRVRYPTPRAQTGFGFDGVPMDPLFHVDAYIAARRRAVDLSDYQAISRAFPVVYQPLLGRGYQYGLMSLEGPGTQGDALLTWLRNNIPWRIDYIIVLGEEDAPEAAKTDLAKVLADLNSSMRLVSPVDRDTFVRVYQRTGPR
jgi:hypothetical protein